MQTFKELIINNMFKFCENSTYNMRSNRCKLALGKPSRNFMKKSFSYRGAVAWNNLPDDITKAKEQFSNSRLISLYNENKDSFLII